jgi:hypothetical protein
MASWYEPSGPMKLEAITEEYVRMMTAGLASGGLTTHAPVYAAESRIHG